jgi:hypothetical protein
MEHSFAIRLAHASDVEAVLSILSEVACRVPDNLSTPQHIEKMKSEINDCCLDVVSLVAVDENGVVVGFQLAKRIHWFDDSYIHLTYAGVTAAAAGKGLFRRLVEAEKGHGLPLVAEVKPGNRSEMAIKLMHYNFRPYAGAHTNSDFTYRWDPK